MQSALPAFKLDLQLFSRRAFCPPGERNIYRVSPAKKAASREFCVLAALHGPLKWVIRDGQLANLLWAAHIGCLIFLPTDMTFVLILGPELWIKCVKL